MENRHVLLRCLHGLGDTIQFIRYARKIRDRARSFAVEAQPRLKALLVESNVADAVFTWGEAEPFWDQQIEVTELPRVFRTTLQNLPSDVPYLEVSSVFPIAPYDGSRPLRVGLCWAGSDYDPTRSVPLQWFAGLFAIPGVACFSVQGKAECAELDLSTDRLVSLCPESSGIVEAAKVLQSLDLIITVDTMIAHLAGALARPVWTLLPYESDWRWMLGREDTPWYPTMRLFRQPSAGDWGTVLRRVRGELEALLAGGQRRYPGTRIIDRAVGQEA